MNANGVEIRTSMSIGAVAYPDDGTTADDLLISADRAMYVSKSQGKNRVVGYLPAGRGTSPAQGEDLTASPTSADRRGGAPRRHGLARGRSIPA